MGIAVLISIETRAAAFSARLGLARNDCSVRLRPKADTRVRLLYAAEVASEKAVRTVDA